MQDQEHNDLSPAQHRPGRRGRAAAAAFSVLVLGTVAALLAGVFTLRVQTKSVGTSAHLIKIEAQNQELHAELTSLNHSLEQLIENLFETRWIEGEARTLVGLTTWPEEPLLSPRSLASPDVNGLENADLAAALLSSATQVDASLRQARALKASFAEIVSSMEENADVWARVPSTRPLHDARMTSRFGLRRDPFTGRLAWHRGLDLVAPTGTPVRASADGVVLRSGRAGGYGLLVEMDHGNGIITRYAHNSRVAVKQGDTVRRGQVVAFVGATGRANAPHLHYEVHVNGNPVNPEPYILPVGLMAE